MLTRRQKLERRKRLLSKTPLKRSPMKRRPRRKKPGDDPKYLAWIRQQPCATCGKPGPSEAAHFGPRSIALKPPDRDTLPLCAHCHRTGPRAHHVIGSDGGFAEAHSLDLWRVIRGFNGRYEER